MHSIEGQAKDQQEQRQEESVKRIALVVLAGALLLATVAGVAVAKTFVCDTIPCYGTKKKDQIGERNGSVRDRIYARAGDDTINASRAENDEDVVFGGKGDDKINVQDGDGRDRACGGPGIDTILLDSGDKFSFDGCDPSDFTTQP
jgi:Ca2+-binding RTX toxin-like protein